MTILFAIVVAFAFFTQSLIGFGGGLIAVPILSLFMPVQDVVVALLLYGFAMGLLIFKTHQKTQWAEIRKLVPGVLIGATLGALGLKYIPGDAMRLILASYIILHLLRTHTKFDPLKLLIEKGGALFSGFLGGTLNTMLATGAPAFVLYLKDRAVSSTEFRANVVAILFLSNIPRALATWSTGLITLDIVKLSLIGFPGFLLALYLGQKFHDRVPQALFFKLVDVVLICSAVSLILKALL